MSMRVVPPQREREAIGNVNICVQTLSSSIWCTSSARVLIPIVWGHSNEDYFRPVCFVVVTVHILRLGIKICNYLGFSGTSADCNVYGIGVYMCTFCTCVCSMMKGTMYMYMYILYIVLYCMPCLMCDAK